MFPDTLDPIPRKRHIHFVRLAATLAALALPVCAIAMTTDAASEYDETLLRIEYGAFCARETVGSTDAPGTAEGRIDLFDGMPSITWRTSTVPAAPNVSFGVKTKGVGGAAYAPVTITLTHPAFTNDGTTTQTYVTDLGGDDGSINAYSFDYPYEMVTGEWQFHATMGDQTLYRVTFNVVPPNALPAITNGCGGALLS